nr:hypothetical protein CFP56_20722 [Quercus suber]
MACSGEEGDRFQGNNDVSFGKPAHHEADSYCQPYEELRPSSLLPGGNSRDFELHGSVEARMGGVQGHVEEVGMEHDGFSQDGN